MAKNTEPKSIERLIAHHNRVLDNLERRLKGCTAEDMKTIIKRDIKELKEKIERIENNERS